MTAARLSIYTAFACLAISIAALADDEPTPRPSFVLKPEKMEFKKGQSLSDRAIVTAPFPVKGVQSWTWETRRHRNRIVGAALHPDGKIIATGGYDGTVRLWDVASGKLLKALVGHDSYVYGLSFSPDGEYLATSGSFDLSVRIWDVNSGLPLRVLKGHPSYVTFVAWSPDAKSVAAVGGESGEASLFDLKSGKITSKVSLGQPVLTLSWHPDSQHVAMISRGQGGVAVWDVSISKLSDPFGEPASTYVTAAYSPDGKYLAAGDAKNTTLFDAESRKESKKFMGGGNAIAWTADSKWLGSAASSDATLRIWNVEDGAAVQTGKVTLNSMYFSPDKTQLHTADATSLYTYDVKGGKLLSTREISGTIPPLWYSGKPVITGVGTPTLTLWESSTGKQLRELKGHTSTISSAAWSPDGKRLATASYDKTIRIWDTADGKESQVLSQHQGPVSCVAWSPDGKSIASGSHDKKVMIWDATTGKVLQTLSDHTDHVTAVSWSPSVANSLATGGKDLNTHVYQTKTWKKSRTLEEKSVVYSLAWSPDGKTLAVGHADAKTRLWNAASGKQLGELESLGSPPFVNAVAWSPTGALLATGMANHTLQFWNTRGQRMQQIQTMAPVQQLAWGAGGAFLAVASGDRTTRIFEPVTGRLKGVFVAENGQVIAISAEGHYRAEGESLDELICIVQTDKGQELLTPTEFAEKYKWKNNPALTKFTGK